MRSQAGFTLIELLVVTVIVALLTGIALPRLDYVRNQAYDRAALADLHSATAYIEEYWHDHNRYPGDEDYIMAEGFTHSPGVSFLKFSIRHASDPEKIHVHMHIAHEASSRYWHLAYPTLASPAHGDVRGLPPTLLIVLCRA